MSYCRFSSDCFKCDVYCYYGFGGCIEKGYIIHVAAKRVVNEIPPMPDTSLAWVDYKKLYDERDAALDLYPRAPIDLPFAGETFEYETLQEFRDKLTELKEIGYRIPEYIFNIIDEEIEMEVSDDSSSNE